MKPDNNRLEMLKQIAAVDFAIIDLHLFLNTHPTDENVVTQYNSLVTQSKMIKQNYERYFGPLCSTESPSAYPWQWINEPWPWENEANYKLS
jgi:spore coat protein JB